MKKLLLALFGLVLACGLHAQETNYRVLYDNPPSPKLNINLEYFGLDMGIKNLDGMAFNIGSFGFYEPVPGIGTWYNVKYGLFTLGKLSSKEVPNNLDLSAGGYLMFNNSTRTKSTKVTLKTEYKGSEFSRNVSGDWVETRTEQVTYMRIPAQRRTMLGVRGGYYLKRGPFISDDIEVTGVDEMSLTSMGLYAGLTMRSIKNVFIDAKGYGVQFNSIGDDFALDVLVVPVNIFKDVNNGNANVSADVRAASNQIPLGFRLGWYRYQIEKKTRTGKKFGLSASFEGGYKPYQSWFVNGNLGITIIKQ